MLNSAIRSTAVALGCAAALGVASAQVAIVPGGSASFSLPGTVSLYQVFGHSGSVAGAASDAPYASFTAGSANVFTFTSVTGGLNCCGNGGALATPEGGNWLGPASNIGGLNGISNAAGNTQLPLVAMFGSEADPFGQVAPAALPAWDASNPVSQAPALYQVFFVGDGRTGRDDANGALLTFTAPVNATRLYVGFVDAFSFNGTSGYYDDNPGAMNATVMLAVPEPQTYALMALGLLGVALGVGRNRRRMR